jgi:Arc/MetJ-type ribon-helix-helix transcriptional regulator
MEVRAVDTMDFSIPEQHRDFVQARIVEGGFGSAKQYLERLIEDDKRRHAPLDLDTELLRGLESGPSVPMTTEDWESIRAEVRDRIEAWIKRVS